MTRLTLIIIGTIALLGPIAFALNMSARETIQSFWEFYPLLVSGVLLSLVFFFASLKFNTNQQSSS